MLQSLQQEIGLMAVQRNNVTVPEAVREVLSRNYPLYQCLKLKLTNFHSVAEYIRPEVQHVTGRTTTINTLVVAIKRYSDVLEKPQYGDPVLAFENSRITLSSGITDLTIKAHKKEFPRIVKELTDLSVDLSEFPNIFPLATSIKLIIPTSEYEQVKPKLKGLDIVSRHSDAAKLTVYLPPKSERVPGIASYVTELLYRNGVNIVDAFLGYEDIIIVVDGPDGHTAYDTLRRETRTAS